MQAAEVIAYVALGANLGEPLATLRGALVSLAAITDTRLVAASSLYRTAPVGLKNQPDFINAVAMLQTALAPRQLLDALFGIEAAFGRSRGIPNAPRTLDLDLLLHGDATMEDSNLILPHPRMHQRAFVLVPLLEITPECHIPGRGAARQFVAACQDQVVVRLPAATA